MQTKLNSNAAREAGQICGNQIQLDRSGQGHNWQDIHAQDIPASVREEIEGEIISGGKDDCDKFVASNGQHYRWSTEGGAQ